MRTRAHRSESSTSRAAFRSPENAAAFSPPPRGASGASRPSLPPEVASTCPEPPDETSAWWLSRHHRATFAQHRIEVADACARALGAVGAARGPIVVEFNGATFEGAALAKRDDRYQLDLGDALAEAMASVLDEDDGLSVEVVRGRAAPTLAIHPYVSSGPLTPETR